MLSVYESVPAGLLELDATRLHELLAGPTLLHLGGRRSEPLFASVLLHGNEDVGWEAVRRLLRRYQERPLPRALSVFIGNVAAARYGLRHLDRQPDFNRIWKGGEEPEQRMMAQVVEAMRTRRVFASVDIHNNTGMNPHYACVNVLRSPFLHLATLFSRTVVYFTTPDSVQSRAFSMLCPAVTVEAGRPGQARGVEHALEYLEACLHLAAIPDHPLAERDLDLFHTVAVAKIPPGRTFSFGNTDSDIRFVDDLDRLNFRDLPAGTTMGWVRPAAEEPLEVWNEHGEEVGRRFFAVRDGELITRVPLMPSMLTMDVDVIRSDCLCYLMERYHAPQRISD